MFTEARCRRAGANLRPVAVGVSALSLKCLFSGCLQYIQRSRWEQMRERQSRNQAKKRVLE